MSLINKNFLTEITESKIRVTGITESKIQDTFQDIGGEQELPGFEIIDVEGCLSSTDVSYG